MRKAFAALLSIFSVAAPAFVTLAPTSAKAQIYIAPPRVVVHAPPVFMAPVPVPPRPRFFRRVRVVRVPAPPVVMYPPPPTVYVAPQPQVIVPPPPEPVYVQPQQLPPIPPPIVAPPPAVYVAPPVAPPVTVVHAAPVRVTRPAFRSQFGLGLRGSGFVAHDKFHGLGVGGEMLIRISPHWTSELAAEYQRNTSGPNARMDIPVTLGMRVHLAKPTWTIQPYLVGALGADFAQQDLKVFTEKAYFFEGQLGGGLEVRLGKHVALTADARFVGRYRVDQAEQETLALKYVDGKPVQPLASSYGGQFRLGAQVYF